MRGLLASAASNSAERTQGWLGAGAAGGSAIDARRLVSGVSGTVMKPRVGRSRSNVTSSSSVTRPAARSTGAVLRLRIAR